MTEPRSVARYAIPEVLTPAQEERVRAAVRALWAEAGSQGNAAHLLGYQQQTVSAVLARRDRPTVAMALRVAGVLNQTATQILGLEPEDVGPAVNKVARTLRAWLRRGVVRRNELERLQSTYGARVVRAATARMEAERKDPYGRLGKMLDEIDRRRAADAGVDQ